MPAPELFTILQGLEALPFMLLGAAFSLWMHKQMDAINWWMMHSDAIHKAAEDIARPLAAVYIRWKHGRWP